MTSARGLKNTTLKCYKHRMIRVRSNRSNGLRGAVQYERTATSQFSKSLVMLVSFSILSDNYFAMVLVSWFAKQSMLREVWITGQSVQVRHSSDFDVLTTNHSAGVVPPDQNLPRNEH